MPKPFDFGGVNLTGGEDSSGARPSPSKLHFASRFWGTSAGVPTAGSPKRRRLASAARCWWIETTSTTCCPACGCRNSAGDGGGLVAAALFRARGFPSRPYFPEPRALWQTYESCEPASKILQRFRKRRRNWGWVLPARCRKRENPTRCRRLRPAPCSWLPAACLTK